MVVKGQDCLERYKINTCLTFAHFEAIRSKFKLNHKDHIVAMIGPSYGQFRLFLLYQDA